jgi:septum formation inhibitor MinC
MKKIQNIVYRRNFNNVIVKCGFLYIEENKARLILDIKINTKYDIKGFLPEIERKNAASLSAFIHFQGNIWLLNEFNRKMRIKKKKRKLVKSSLRKEDKEVKKWKQIEAQRVADARAKMKETKKAILNGNKSNKLKIDIFKDEKTLGTLGDFFSSNLKIEENQDNQEEIEKTKILVNPLKKIDKHKSKKGKNNNTEILVLWDIENVHFYNDFSHIGQYIPKNSIKIFSYSKKNHKNKIYLKGDKLDFVLNKLRKRGWIEKRTTKIADKELIEEFNSRSDKIKELYLITADKDFKIICEKAVELGIIVHIINNEGRNKYSWFNKDIYNYSYIRNRNDY